MVYLLDADTLSYLLKGRPPVTHRFRQAVLVGDEFLLRRHRDGKPIEDADLLIAISARQAGATIVTNNTRHFDGLGIPVVNWAQP
jgi:tRNA(fMet)-specific endonuclease VapC